MSAHGSIGSKRITNPKTGSSGNREALMKARKRKKANRLNFTRTMQVLTDAEKKAMSARALKEVLASK
jgi:hypothetical protein